MNDGRTSARHPERPASPELRHPDLQYQQRDDDGDDPVAQSKYARRVVQTIVSAELPFSFHGRPPGSRLPPSIDRG
jgi:hypothetical protein